VKEPWNQSKKSFLRVKSNSVEKPWMEEQYSRVKSQKVHQTENQNGSVGESQDVKEE
jgi:hypothetical protein